MASGWMAVRKMRRGSDINKGFVLSDHADWKGLNEAVRATGAENVLVTHGYTATFSRWLREQGYNAQELQTLFGGEENGE
jgi:putative mRNA 3-end processing factor